MRKACCILAVFLSGCCHKPDIPNYHWGGSTLYNQKGEQVAAVVTMDFFGEPSQACVFAQSGIANECTYWETGQQAYDHVGKVFREHQ